MEDAMQCRDLAHQAASWVVRHRSDATESSIYRGLGGITLFLLQGAEALKDDSLRDAAANCADDLLAHIDDEAGTGLYIGLAGTAFVLAECGRGIETDRWDGGVQRCMQLLAQRTEPVGTGRAWSSVTDIVSGTAGTGLALLRLHERGAHGQALEPALAAADALVASAVEAPGGLSWPMDPSYERIMPNFSHGTAGVAYFLARAGVVAGRNDLVEAALAGAGHLLAIADTEDDTCLVHHHSPDGEDLYYLGWCHGPVGTGRLFEALFQATGDPTWRTWLERAARGLLQSGIPEHRPEGFWENVGQCCGNAGAVEFCLDAAPRTTLATELQDLARRMVVDVQARVSHEADGAFWSHVESRRDPATKTSQPGFMQGASGIGSMLLRYADALDGHGEASRIRLPDNPF